MERIPVAWKKTQEILKKLSYPISDNPVTDGAKQIHNVYIDKDGNLVIVSDE